MRTQGRGQTLSGLFGIFVGMVAAGLVLPFVVGDRVATTGLAGPSLTGDPADAPVGEEGFTPEDGGVVSDSGPGGVAGPSGPGGSNTGRTPGAPGSTGGGPVAGLTASDVGVSATEIKLGFVVLNVGPLNDLGTAVGLEVEQQQAAIDALVQDLNDRGGILGRKVVAETAIWDVLDPNSGRRVCLELTEEKKVFAAIGSVFPPDVPCYAREHGTYLLWNCGACPDSTFADASGLVSALAFRGSRHMGSWIPELERVRYLEGITEVGIVMDETNDPGAEMSKQLQGVLEGSGRTVVRLSRLSGDLQTGSGQIPVEVNQQRTAGAQAVFFVANRLFATQFVQQADSQGWHPKYSTSEGGFLNVDTCCENMPESFDGTLGITTAFDEDKPEPATSVRCREFHDQRTGRTLRERGSNEYSLTMGWCDYLTLFERAATDAGPTLTRASFHAGIESIGATGQLAGSMGGVFARGKPDGEDFVRLQVWRAECRCWEGAGDFHQY